MAKRSRGRKPQCTVDLGVDDREIGLPEGAVSALCWACGAKWWVTDTKTRCVCGSKLRVVIQLDRLTLGAIKQAMMRKD